MYNYTIGSVLCFISDRVEVPSLLRGDWDLAAYSVHFCQVNVPIHYSLSLICSYYNLTPIFIQDIMCNKSMGRGRESEKYVSNQLH